MLIPNIPIDETERQRELESLEVLDSEPEKSFDEITKLAAQVCDTPIALISFIDKNRQWFKSRYGLEIHETPRDHSFCAHAIHQNDIFEIEDSHQDSRFTDNPLVSGPPHIRFYAGQPLISSSNTRLGTLCVIGHKPKRLEDAQIRLLRILARNVMDRIELRARERELWQANYLISRQAHAIHENHGRLVKAEKMASLGRLAGGIAHEINNPLAIIQGRTERLRDVLKKHELDGQADCKKCIDGIENGIQRATKIIKGMTQLARNSKSSLREPVNLYKAFESVTGLVRSRFDEADIKLSLELPRHLEVFCDSTQLSQIIMNLLNNAFDAVENQDERKILVKTKETESNIEFFIEDTGHGLPEEMIEKTGKAFFTTKPTEKGVGLGLSISCQLIEANEGQIDFKNRPEGGAQICVSLPKPNALLADPGLSPQP